MSVINNLINFDGVSCLNEKKKNSLKHVLISSETEDHFLESDDDEQLLLFIPFKETVNLSGITFEKKDFKTCPKRIKIFQNADTMDFDDVEKRNPTVSKKLNSKKMKTEDIGKIKLKPTKFRQTKSLTIFIENNLGEEDITQIGKIQIFGEVHKGCNMSDLKPVKS